MHQPIRSILAIVIFIMLTQCATKSTLKSDLDSTFKNVFQSTTPGGAVLIMMPSIRNHHERFDGTGYPDRLIGEEIPLGARIIHVADALDSMLTTRTYRAARPLEEALEELRTGSGSQFCPRCVSALERILPAEEALRQSPRTPALLAAS